MFPRIDLVLIFDCNFCLRSQFWMCNEYEIDVTPIGFNGHKPTETKSIAEVALESEMQKRHMSEKKQLEYLQAVRALVSEAVRVTYSMPKSLRPATKNGKPVCRRCAMPYTFRL